MKSKISLVIVITSIVLTNISFSVPPPCTPEELLESSDYAIEGVVKKIECDDPYDSQECKPDSENGINFVPELVANCTATVEVTKNIKGNYNVGHKAPMPFTKLVQKCENGAHLLPGSPLKNVTLNSKIKYYNSTQCKYWNYTQISTPTVPPINN